MQRSWVLAQASCQCSPAVLLSGVQSKQTPSSTAAQAHWEPSLPTTFLATAWGFHFLPDSLLNLHQILNKHPNQLCWVTLYVFPSFRICQLLAAFLTEAHQLGASITACGMRTYLLGERTLKGKNCLIQSVSSSTNPGCFFPLQPQLQTSHFVQFKWKVDVPAY